jgi:PEGA domain
MDEFVTPGSSKNTETQPGNPPNSPGSSPSFTPAPFLREAAKSAGGALTNDMSGALSLFPPETEASDSAEKLVDAMSAGGKAPEINPEALGDFHGELPQPRVSAQQSADQVWALKRELDEPRRAAEERKQSVERAGTFKTELDQLREAAQRLEGEYARTEDARQASEERSALAVKNELLLLEDLRGQIRHAEMAIKESVDLAGTFKIDVDQLRVVALRLAGDLGRTEETMRAVEERSAATLKAVTAIETRLAPLQDVVVAADARIAALNDPAEQKANRMAESITAMDARFAKVKDDVATDFARFQKRVQALTASAPRHGSHFDASDARLGERLRSVFAGSARAAAAGRGLLDRSLIQAMPVLSVQKAQLIRHQRAVIAAVCLAALVSLVMMRFGGNSEPTGGEAVPPAKPVIAASRVVSPEVMLRTAVPAVPQIKLSATKSAVQSARTVNTQTGRTLTAQAAAAQPARTTVQVAPPEARGQAQEFTGTLAVRSDPAGATVFVNRQRVGETPLQLTRVRAGTQVVWIERPGYLRWTTAARVVADTLTRIDVELEPERVRP